jgi:hypothetical protein
VDLFPPSVLAGLFVKDVSVLSTHYRRSHLGYAPREKEIKEGAEGKGECHLSINDLLSE